MLFPLAEFYRRSGQGMPAFKWLEGDLVPEPYRSLLVHDRDMTPTLEQFWGEMLHLEPLRVREIGDLLFRDVVLVTDSTQTPAEFGAIRIHLDEFEPEARAAILECHTPLGAILRDYEIEHTSHPTNFFSITNDRAASQALGVSGDHVLYGRHNVLQAGQSPLAEVIEILPPIEQQGVLKESLS